MSEQSQQPINPEQDIVMGDAPVPHSSSSLPTPNAANNGNSSEPLKTTTTNSDMQPMQSTIPNGSINQVTESLAPASATAAENATAIENTEDPTQHTEDISPTELDNESSMITDNADVSSAIDDTESEIKQHKEPLDPSDPRAICARLLPPALPEDPNNKKPAVFGAVYSGVSVYEMLTRGVSVMRRLSDSYLNATQILKVAGIDKTRRTKILEKEVLSGEHEKVQGGYGKYQGTWVPFERGVELCVQYRVHEHMRPILELEMSEPFHAIRGAGSTQSSSEPAVPRTTSGTGRKRTGGGGGGGRRASTTVGGITLAPKTVLEEEGRSMRARRSVRQRKTGFSYNEDDEERHGTPAPRGPETTLDSPRHKRMRTDEGVTDGADETYFSYGMPSLLRQQHGMNGYHGVHGYGHDGFAVPHPIGPGGYPFVFARQFPHHQFVGFPPQSYPTDQSHFLTTSSSNDAFADLSGTSSMYHSISEPSMDIHRNLLMAIFLNEDPKFLPDIINQNQSTGPVFNSSASASSRLVDLDRVIDEQGNTLTHWAAILGRITMLQYLKERGANVALGNYISETPLMRAVGVTNNYDNQSFMDLLQILGRSNVHLVDSQNRSVLHHIAITSGLPGRSASCKYYMETLFEWIAQYTGSFTQLVCVQDVFGDSALNIAARVGNKALVSLLLEAGGDPYVENRAGVKPIDFGIEKLVQQFGYPHLQQQQQHHQPENQLGDNSNIIPTIAVAAESDGNNDSGLPLLSIQSIVDEFRSGRLGIECRDRQDEIIAILNDPSISQLVTSLMNSFTTRMQTQQSQLTTSKQTLRNLTQQLAQTRHIIDEFKTQAKQFLETQWKVRSMEASMGLEVERTRQVRDRVLNNHEDVDMTEPVIDGAESDIRTQLAQSQQTEAELRQRLLQLKSTPGSETEMKCKKIISVCIGIPLASVDTIVEDLVKAVESEESVQKSFKTMIVQDATTSSSSSSAENQFFDMNFSAAQKPIVDYKAVAKFMGRVKQVEAATAAAAAASSSSSSSSNSNNKPLPTTTPVHTAGRF